MKSEDCYWNEDGICTVDGSKCLYETYEECKEDNS